MRMDKERVFRSRVGHTLKVGIKGDEKLFKVEIKLSKALEIPQLDILEGLNLFDSEDATVSHIEHNRISNGFLMIGGCFEESFVLENFKPQETSLCQWVELLNYKKEVYTAKTTLETFTTSEQEGLTDFLYTFSKEDDVVIDEYFLNDPEDRVSAIYEVVTKLDTITIFGTKTKAL